MIKTTAAAGLMLSVSMLASAANIESPKSRHRAEI
jgi:hypothetical protein